jgi:uncharacterized protein YdeI (YjbR/CyaY-like superfamily)
MKTITLQSGTVHKIPKDFALAILAEETVKELWLDITPLARNEWICWVDSAKQSSTRDRRIKAGVDKMLTGMRRPCCWAGCPHRTKNL